MSVEFLELKQPALPLSEPSVQTPVIGLTGTCDTVLPNEMQGKSPARLLVHGERPADHITLLLALVHSVLWLPGGQRAQLARGMRSSWRIRRCSVHPSICSDFGKRATFW